MSTTIAACPSCGNDIGPGSRFCANCGAATADVATGVAPRTVTIVTSDLQGSTALGERLDPESLREVMTTYIDEMRAVFERHGGTIEKIIGDAIVAVFGLAKERDDDALRAVEGAAESQRALALLNDQLDQRWGVRLVVRTGVATGEVVVGEAGEGQHVLTGPTLARATTMEQNSPAQEVLLTESTYLAVRDAVEVDPFGIVAPKGGGEELNAFRLVGVAERDTVADEQSTAKVCSICGTEAAEGDAFCTYCGSPMAGARPHRDTRKTVTVVFADPKPATADGSRPTPEAMRDVMSRYFAAMRRELERHGGTVEKFIGDAVMAVFGLPVRHEDDAVRAVRAAADMQAALIPLNETFSAEYGITLNNHIGVNTGEVVAGDASLGQRLVTGDVVNVAARLEQAAGSREILLGELTHQLARNAVTVEPVEPLTLKGKSQPVPAFRLGSVLAVDADVQQRADTPMVGREAELAALTDALADARHGRVCRMATVVGDAGVGKTRLIREFTTHATEGAVVARGRCLPYGDGITFWPLREAVRELAGITVDAGSDEALGRLRSVTSDSAVVERLASVIGLSADPFPVAEIFWAARRFLEEFGRERAVLMVIDDIHWAEQTFLDLLVNLVESVDGASVMILCSSRHELLERQEEWGQSPGSLRLVLSPLSDADAGRVVESLLGGAEIDDEARSRIVEAAAGNPLFVEQLLSMLIDEGTLARDGQRWVAIRDLSGIRVPPTIEALLAARLDMLKPDERGVIEPASVVGQNFAVAAVKELVAGEIAPEVPAHLQAMTTKELIQPMEEADEYQTDYRFHHLLVRDAAYNGLLKRERADLHERFVTWAEGFNASHGVDNREFEEIHGYHLEQAYAYLSELGTVDERVRAIGVKGSRKLGSAGERALARGDFPAAASLMRRSTALREREDPERLFQLPTLAEVLTELGRFVEAGQVLQDAVSSGAEAGADAVVQHARLVQLYAQLYSGESEDEQDWSSAVTATSEEALPVFEASQYMRGLTFAWRMRVGLYGAAQQAASTESAAEQVIRYARAGSDVRAEVKGSLAYAHAAVYGPAPVRQGVRRIKALAESAGGDQHAVATMNLLLSQLYAMDRQFDAARTLYRANAAKLAELQAGFTASSTSLDSARVEMLAGDNAAAEKLLRRDFDALQAMDERYLLATVAGLLGRALIGQGKDAEADVFISQAEELAASDDVDAQAIAKGVRARLLASAGQADGAAALAHEAVALREGSDYVVDHAEALFDLTSVLEILGDHDGAAVAAAKARALARKKGNRAMLDLLRAVAPEQLPRRRKPRN
ncbi:MAG TPA: adenylate/guanylate cyclase domain-containing protein [Candidatus Limnocylindria bacterium]|nr:adenylate/guanylate cyclase domain-containing protein [Candidatus Limnocylindria bacterium]